MPKQTEPDPQTRILDAAEDAIGEMGFAGASLRHIATTARVNLATAYYYFGSKRGLMEAVLSTAIKAGAHQTARWMGTIFVEANRDSSKPSFDRYITAVDAFEAGGWVGLATGRIQGLLWGGIGCLLSNVIGVRLMPTGDVAGSRKAAHSTVPRMLREHSKEKRRNI